MFHIIGLDTQAPIELGCFESEINYVECGIGEMFNRNNEALGFPDYSRRVLRSLREGTVKDEGSGI